jgi:transposase
MPQSRTRSSGMAVPNDTSAVAYVATAHDAEVVFLGTMGPRPGDLDQRIRQRPSTATQLICVYAAGPWGSWLYRDLMQQGSDGWVVAPALSPPTPGERGKPDRRDAVPLARLARAGDLTVVDIPQVAAAALRDLSRARDDTRRDVQSATFRLNAFGRRHEIRDTGRATGGPAHLRWRADVGWPTPAQPIVLQASVRAIHAPTERRQRLDPARHDPVTSWRVLPVGEARQALRGVQCLAAVTMGAAIGDLTRVEPPRALRQCLGLIPAEDATGARRRQGAMTNAGTTQARRALVAGAGADRDPAQVRRPRPRRLETPPQVMPDIRGQAQVRRCTR